MWWYDIVMSKRVFISRCEKCGRVEEGYKKIFCEKCLEKMSSHEESLYPKSADEILDILEGFGFYTDNQIDTVELKQRIVEIIEKYVNTEYNVKGDSTVEGTLKAFKVLIDHHTPLAYQNKNDDNQF